MTRADAVRLLYDTLEEAVYNMCRCCPECDKATYECRDRCACFVKKWREVLNKTKGAVK